MLNMQQPSR